MNKSEFTVVYHELNSTKEKKTLSIAYSVSQTLSYAFFSLLKHGRDRQKYNTYHGAFSNNLAGFCVLSDFIGNANVMLAGIIRMWPLFVRLPKVRYIKIGLIRLNILFFP